MFKLRARDDHIRNVPSLWHHTEPEVEKMSLCLEQPQGLIVDNLTLLFETRAMFNINIHLGKYKYVFEKQRRGSLEMLSRSKQE